MTSVADRLTRMTTFISMPVKSTCIGKISQFSRPPVLGSSRIYNFIMAEAQPDLPPPIIVSFSEVEMIERPNEFDEGKASWPNEYRCTKVSGMH